VAGAITSIEPANTSYGPRVYLGLDGGPLCHGGGSVLGDPNVSYQLGATFQTTLHFQAYTINGDPAVSAPELYCPFPLLLGSIGSVGGAVSLHTGLLLAYTGTAANGTLQYGIITGNGAAYRPDKLSVTLRKSTPIRGSNPRLPVGGPVDSAARWSELGAFSFLATTGAYSELPAVDKMRSLVAGISDNGSLRYADVNRNGLLDDGDRLDVSLGATGSPASYDTYLLMIGGSLASDETYVSAQRFIVNGPRGPLDIPLRERQEPYVALHYDGDRVGATLTSDIGVSLRFGTAPLISSLRFYLDPGGSSSYAKGNLSDLPITTRDGVSLALDDTNGNGRLDSGDVFHVGNLANRSSVVLDLGQGDVTEVGRISWVVGYGEPIGRFPLYWFASQGTGPWRVTANPAFWSPELAFNRTFRGSLFENGVAVLTNVSLRNGTLGTFANGSLAFTDVDGDGTLSTGDQFIVTGVSSNQYFLELALFYGYPQRVTL